MFFSARPKIFGVIALSIHAGSPHRDHRNRESRSRAPAAIMEFVRTSPTFRRRRLARRIRRLREDAGLTQEQAAASLDMSTSALSRRETGEVATSVHEVAR